VAENTLKGYIQEIKTDFITHDYPLVSPLHSSHGVRLASTLDIGAMKLRAISHSGNRQKDFFDLYFLLEHYPLSDLLDAFARKYASSNPLIALKGLVYFDDIDFALEKPLLVRKITFEEVKKRLIHATRFPDLIFNP
jgi:hypothetical protein